MAVTYGSVDACDAPTLFRERMERDGRLAAFEERITALFGAGNNSAPPCTRR